MNTFAIISFCILIFVYHKSWRKFFDLVSEELNDLSFGIFWSLLVCGFKMTFTICEYVKGVKNKTIQRIQRKKTPLAPVSYRFLTQKNEKIEQINLLFKWKCK